MIARIEVEAANKPSEKNRRVAAFFDLDGTLIPLPSLERKFFKTLRYQKAISAKNYFHWIKEAVRLLPRRVSAILQENKMYLRGIAANGWGAACLKPAPKFFKDGLERMAWHAKKGHTIVLISGTLEPLAQVSTRTIESLLAARGISLTIRVCATRLGEADGHWTGRILGEAMFGEAKAVAAKKIALEMKLDLAHSYAYGDSPNDRWLLAAVGRPFVVNPSDQMARLALLLHWPVLYWEKETKSVPRVGKRRIIAEKKDLPRVIA